VEDVREFPGHIACDEGSRSEIVVPILAGGKVSSFCCVWDANGLEKESWLECMDS